MNVSRRGFLGILGVGCAALALRPKFSLLTSPVPLVLEEPPEPIELPKIGPIDMAAAYAMLKELYADDVIYQESIYNNPFTAIMKRAADTRFDGAYLPVAI